MLYAARNGLKVETDIDNIIGIALDTYIPELKLAIELDGVTKTEHEFQTVKEHICKCNDIKYVRIKQISDFFKMAQSIREAFGKCHTYFSADDKNDIELLKKRFAEWQKRKVV